MRKKRKRRRKRKRKRSIILENKVKIVFPILQVLHPVRRESIVRQGVVANTGSEEAGDEVDEVYRKICQNLRHNLENIKAYKKVSGYHRTYFSTKFAYKMLNFRVKLLKISI